MIFNTIARTRVTYTDPNDGLLTVPAGTIGVVVPPDIGPALVAVRFPDFGGLTVIYDVDDVEEATDL